MKIIIPNKPFTTSDFSLRGGGIDFLGLRWVNLTIVGRDLIPELNNVTTDMGVFFLGAWIPWKFRQLCDNVGDYTEANYKSFREKVEVALSLTFREDCGVDRAFGLVRNRVGITQKCELPSRLSFEDAQRREPNSLYAAAIYGPSLRALGFLTSYYSLAREGERALNIAVPSDDTDAIQIVRGVDAELRKASSYRLIASLDSATVRGKDIQKLANAGLDPARFRASSHIALKRAFRRKLLPSDPDDQGYARTLTTKLLLATIQQRDRITTSDIRVAWYVGMFVDGKRLKFADPALSQHSQRWSCFMARQYQRFAIELFLWCFEDAIGHGSRSISDVIEHWSARTKTAGLNLNGTFIDLACKHAGSLLMTEETAISRAWNDRVHGGDVRFEHIAQPQDDKAVIHGLKMIAGWYWRMLVRMQNQETKDLMSLGGADRISMSWFLGWVSIRKNFPIREILRDIFSDLVFAQHMRIAVARFDGSSQRLRFLIGDGGIEPTVSAQKELGRVRLPWMPDRLDTLVGLLSDCGVLIESGGNLRLGPASSELLPKDAAL
jgi:hypothetical protein